ncbi:ECF transporter S component [Zongyangia hominis]|uniref:Riboflavin transporter n=1 Tax=Zongyangia hominis TaxID=2763677 RepID=A0A926EF95_9FIRM|nr:ECF transporter S component [Zongyangia hominis]MBC8570776.1 ECF transporter S component [Zongyangia hominis]
MKINTRKMAMMAMLAAISVVLVIIHVPFPPAPFLEYDPADIPILIGAFAFGPTAGLLITVVVSVVQGFTLSSGSGIIGVVMHILATGSFVLVAGSIYSRKKTRKSAVLGLSLGALTMTVMMVLMNLVFTPIFMNTPIEAVAKMLLPIIIPFNLMKAGINAVVTLVLYKAVSRFLKEKTPKLGKKDVEPIDTVAKKS